MQASICAIDGSNDVCAAEIPDSGQSVIFEVLDCFALEIGDVIEHDDFAGVGREIYCNVTQGEDFEVRVICSVDGFDMDWFRS